MKIFDKAKWQIEGGIPQNIAVEYFVFIFDWLKSHKMLNENGKEEIEIGIDDEISLTSEMITEEACEFLETYYDDILEKGKYNIESTKNLLEMYYHSN